jgi:hypothetical protein
MSDDNYKSYLVITPAVKAKPAVEATENTPYVAEIKGSDATLTHYSVSVLQDKPIKDVKNRAIILFCSTDITSTNSNYSYITSDANTYSSIVSNKNPPGNSLTMVLSDATYLDQISANPDVFTSIKDLGYNTTCISYYNYYKNAYLTQNERKYENMFINFNYSFIPMDSLKSYISTHPLYVKP